MSRGTIAALAAVTAMVLAAPAGAQQYDETENWRNAYGRTVDHWTAPNRTVQNALISAQRAIGLAREADRIPSRSAQQSGAWPWNGDVERGGYGDRGSWTGIKLEFEFDNDRGQSIAATLWAPNDAMLTQRGLQKPLPGLVYAGGIISSQPMYYWFAQEMARNGYVVLTHDVSGQGRSEGSSTGNNTQDLRNALDFFVSTPEAPYAHGGELPYNPLYQMLDRARIGTAGHSLGAGAVQSVADHCGVVKAISAHSDLRASFVPGGDTPTGACGPRKPVPIQGQGADYESFVFPPTPTPNSNVEGKKAAFTAIAPTGLDVQEVVIESGTHMAWSHVTWAYTSSWSEQVAFHYALAWFDRYLYGDLVRDGKSAGRRLTDNYTVDPQGHGLSRKFRSAYSIKGGALRCEDMRACPPPADADLALEGDEPEEPKDSKKPKKPKVPK